MGRGNNTHKYGHIGPMHEENILGKHGSNGI